MNTRLRDAARVSRHSRQRRVRSLADEVSTLRRVIAVALAEKASAQRILDDVERDPRNGVSIVRHIEVCQQLHRTEAANRELEERARARI